MGEPEKTRQEIEQNIHNEGGVFIYKGKLLKTDNKFFTRNKCFKSAYNLYRQDRMKDLQRILRGKYKQAEKQKAREEYQEWLDV